MTDRGLAINIDCDVLWYVSNMCGRDYSRFEDELRAYVRRCAGHGITDLLFNISGMCSCAPTKVLTYYGDNLRRTVERGVAVDYHDRDALLPYDAIARAGIDGYAVLLDESKKQGMNGWISVRMNDCHDNGAFTSHMRGQLFYDALDNGWMLDDECVPPYFRRCLNYACEPVRRTMLAYIEEQVNHFDAYGLELDFQREIFCFKYTSCTGAASIMNGFIAQVHETLEKRGKELGHPVKLAVRTLRDIEQSKVLGFDVRTWVKNGWVDVLVPSPRWETCDHAIPVADWKNMTAGTKTEVWVAQEVLCNVSDTAINVSFGFITQTPETAKGFAAEYRAMDCDKIYLFNFFQTCGVNGMENGAFAERYDWCKKVWDGCADVASSLSGTRRHIAGYQDLGPVGYEKYRLFPLEVKGEASFTMNTARIFPGDSVTVVLAFDKDCSAELTVDGTKAEPIDVPADALFTACVEGLKNPETKKIAREWAVPKAFDVKACSSGDNRLLTVKAESAVIKYIEITVKHG